MIQELKTKNTLFSLLNQGNDLSNVCTWCIGYTKANSYHCPYCKKCISFQEFHNSLLNNCIGKNNFKHYLFYLFFVTFYFGVKFLFAIYIVRKSYSTNIQINIEKPKEHKFPIM